jgi:hypothetical protein
MKWQENGFRTNAIEINTVVLNYMMNLTMKFNAKVKSLTKKPTTFYGK